MFNDVDIKKDRESSFWIWFLLGVCVFFVCALVMSTSVQASETSEDTGYTDEERLNFLEIRLEELGYTISEMGDSIEALQTDVTAQEELRLSLSEQLDLVIIALNNLIENDIAMMTGHELEMLDTVAYREIITGALATNEMSIVELNENTVSGNSLISDFNSSMEENLQLVSDNTLQELNKTLLTTNTFLSYVFILLLIVLVLIIVYGLGALLNKIIFKHVN